MIKDRTYPGGPLNVVENVRTIPELLIKSSEKYPEKIALREWDEKNNIIEISYSMLSVKVDSLAKSILEMESSPVVAVVGNNSIRWAIVYLATARAGGIVVPMDKELPHSELQAIIHYSGSNIVFFDTGYEEEFTGFLNHTPNPIRLINMEESGKKPVLFLNDLMEKGKQSSVDLPWSYDPDRTFAICYTSGTMGRAKGVMLSNRNICSDIYQKNQMITSLNEDVFLSVLPIHHSFECTCGFLGPLSIGASVFFCRGLRYIADDLAASRATVMLGVPLLWESMYRKIMDGIAARRGGRLKLSIGKGVSRAAEVLLKKNIRRKVFSPIHEKVGGSVRLFVSGGAGIDPDVSKGFRELGLNFIQGYGLTETSPILTVNRDTYFKDASVGFPLPEVEMRIEDPDEEGVGEIVAKGPNIMQGYYNDVEETAKVLKDGWFYTGDFGKFDDEGFLYVTGRKKNVIIAKNGKNVYPEEIQTVLNRSRIIIESMVFGVESESKGEEINVVIVPDMDELIAMAERQNKKLTKEFAQKCIRTEIRNYNVKQPQFKRISSFIIREEELAKTTTKKIKRREVLKETGLKPEESYQV